MNWETTYWDIGVSSLLQTATELQLIVRLFSVRTPALQLGFGGRKFRLWLEVMLFLLLVPINIYIHILIHLNHLARAWEKAATVGPGGAGAERRFWCWKVCSFYPTVWAGAWFLGSCVSSQRRSDQATSSSFPSWSASSSSSSPLLPWRQGIEGFLIAGLSGCFTWVVSLYPHKNPTKEAPLNKLMGERREVTCHSHSQVHLTPELRSLITSWMIVNVHEKEVASYVGDAMDLYSMLQAVWWRERNLTANWGIWVGRQCSQLVKKEVSPLGIFSIISTWEMRQQRLSKMYQNCPNSHMYVAELGFERGLGSELPR